jgi:two-component system, OmpR family, sensor kinase
MRAVRRWLGTRTLRGRLIAGLLALLFLACATVGAVTYAHLRGVLVTQLDDQLRTAGQRYAGCLHPGNGSAPGSGGTPAASGTAGSTGAPGSSDPADSQTSAGADPADCAQRQAPATLSAMITGGAVTNQHLAAGDGMCNLTGADRAELLRLRPNAPTTVTLSPYGQYRVLATTSGDGRLISGLPLAPVDSTLRQVAVAEIAVFGAALLLAGILGAVWVRLSLRPLLRVAATATTVTRLPLASGEVSMPAPVPDANPRTEVGQVGSAFNLMLGHVHAALARRAASEARLRRFAADASHELRTPLAAIRGYAELARRYDGEVPAEVAHALSRVEAESARMSLLVDELLLLAQLDAGRPLATEPVDLTRLAIDVASDARVAAPDHQWLLDLPEEPVIVSGDEHRLHQVLANLLSNAARHTPPATSVTLALAPPAVTPPPGTTAPADPTAPADSTESGALAEAESGSVRLTVTDDGPGIPAELQSEVFERFVRGSASRSPAAGSSGLGLAIVQAVAAAHGGRADVSSRPGRTVFTVTLPRTT